MTLIQQYGSNQHLFNNKECAYIRVWRYLHLTDRFQGHKSTGMFSRRVMSDASSKKESPTKESRTGRAEQNQEQMTLAQFPWRT
jgi:hypothetical protein